MIMERNHKGGHRQSLRQTVRPCTPAPFSCCYSLKRQQGVTSILFVFLLATVILVFMALAVDSARLYNAHSKLQNQANAAAIAAVNATQACGSIDQNGNLTADPEANLRQTAEDAAKGAGWDGTRGSLAATGGVLDSGTDNIFVFRQAPVVQSNAVHVVLTRKTPKSIFLPGWLTGSFNLSAQATAKKELIATLSASGRTAVVGGGPAERNLLNSLLGAILNNGTPFSLDATDLGSLANATVKVGDLLNKLGVKDLVGIVDPQKVTAEALAQALQSLTQNDITSGAGTVIDKLVNAAGINTLKVSDILNIVGNAQVPADATFPVYDLVMGLTLDLVKHTLFSFPNTSIQIPGITGSPMVDVSIGLYVGKPPVISIGPALAKGPVTGGSATNWRTHFDAADVSLMVHSKLDINLLLARVVVNVPLAVKTGGGDGWLVGASCRRGLSNDVVFKVNAQSELANIKTGTVDGANGKLVPGDLGVKVTLLLDLVPLLNVGVQLDLPVNSSGVEHLTFDADLHDIRQQTFVPMTQSVGDGNINVGTLSDSLDLNLQLLGLDLSGLGNLLNPVLNMVGGLVNGLGQAVLKPLLQVLGLQLGQLDVSLVNAVQSPATLVPGKITCIPESVCSPPI